MLTDQCVRHMVRRSYGAVEKGYVSLTLHQSPTHVSNINGLCKPVLNARLFLCLLCRTIASVTTVRVYLILFLIVPSIGEVTGGE